MSIIDKHYPNAERWAKLPVWARDEFRRMVDQRDRWKREYEKSVEHEASAIEVEAGYVSASLGDEKRRFLDTDARVRYWLASREWIELHLERTAAGPLRLVAMGSDTLSVKPRAANVVWLEVEE